MLSNNVKSHREKSGVECEGRHQKMLLIFCQTSLLAHCVPYLDHDDWRWDFTTGVEVERDVPVCLDLFCESAGYHFGQGLLLGLGLTGKLGAAVTETGDVVLHVRYLVLQKKR